MGLTTADVDECNGRNNCTNKEVCVNDPGSYHCRCITGYHRDGDGGACVPDQPAGPPSDQRTGQPSLAINLAIGKSFYCILPSVLSHFCLSQLNFIKRKKKCTICKISYF